MLLCVYYINIILSNMKKINIKKFNIYLTIIILFVTSITIIIIYNRFEKYQNITNLDKVIQFYNNPDINNIPIINYEQDIDINAKVSKIIHQIAPADKSKWNPIWAECQKTWLANFPDYTYMMWNDEEDINNYIKEKYNWFYPIYMSYPRKIMRIDACRYFFLYEYGGIYADMDYECIKNFENYLPSGKACIAESPISKEEGFQNALMASPPKHPFWLCAILNLYKYKDNKDPIFATGPQLAYKTINENPSIFFALPYQLFSPRYNNDFKLASTINKGSVLNLLNNLNKNNTQDIYARHHGTLEWLNI